MKMTKKVLSLLLALSMVIGVFSVVAYAKAPDTAVDLYISCDKASYMPGDEVTLTVSQQVVDTVGPMYMGGQYAIGYNSKGIVPLTTTSTDPLQHGMTAIAPGYDISISDVVDSITAQGDTVTESGATAYNWDNVLLHVVGDDSTEIDCTSKTDLFSFKMKIPEDAANGEYVVGFNQASYEGYIAFSNNPAGGVYGYTDDYGYGTAVNYNFGTCTIKVGAAVAESILKPMSSQIRFKGVKTEADFATYNALPEDQKTFDVRTRATIATADFNAKFTDEATALAGITEFGFIYAFEDLVPTFDIETAKKVADGTGSDANYVKSVCHYMQRTDAGYNFTCLITGIKDAEHNKKVNCIAYVCFNGEYIFFDAPATADYGTLYNTYHK